MVAWAGREAMVQTVVAGETGAAAAKEESAWLTCVERGTRRLRKRSIARALAPKLTAEKFAKLHTVYQVRWRDLWNSCPLQVLRKELARGGVSSA